MRTFNLFNFVEKKINTAKISTVTAELIEQVAFKELALFIGISYIANALSKCEIKTYENGEEKRDLLYYRLNVSPNPNQNASQFMNQLIENLYYHGESLVVMYKDYLYCASNFDCDDSNPLNEYTYHNVSFNSKTIKNKFKSSEVFHFKLDNKKVKTLIDTLYAQYGQIMELALQTFKRTNGKKYKLLLENYKAGDTAFNEVFEKVLKAQLKAFIENDNAIYPQFKGMDLQEFGTASSSGTNDIISMRKEIFDTTAQALKIPNSMMYGNITNMNEIVKVFLSICIDPLADMISEEFTRKKYSFDDWHKGSYVEVDTSCINHVDIFEVAEKVDKAISSGLTSIDELRPLVRLNKLNTDFSSAHFMTKNYDLIENVLKNLQSEGVS